MAGKPEQIRGAGKKFTKDYQPTPEAKSQGRKRLTKMKEALEYLGGLLHAVETTETGEEIQLTWEAQIGKSLIQKAMKGDLQAIKLLGDFLGWEAPKTQNLNVKGEIKEMIDSGNLFLDAGPKPEGKEPKSLK